MIIAIAAAAVLTAAVLVLIFVPKGDSEKSHELDMGVDMERSVDGSGLHQVEIKTDKDEA